VLLMSRRGKLLGTARLPLGIFVCGGGLATLFVGYQILKWYFHFWR
jgi:prepilin signal peptidase PulO-like enzyme (type II secretory pathway)